MRLIYAAFLLMVSGFAHSQSVPPKLYAVIFEVTVNSTGKVESLKVAKVIDPSTHTTGPSGTFVQKVLIAPITCWMILLPRNR